MADTDVDLAGHTDKQKCQSCNHRCPDDPVSFETRGSYEPKASDSDKRQEWERSLDGQRDREKIPPACLPGMTEQIALRATHILLANFRNPAEEGWGRNPW